MNKQKQLIPIFYTIDDSYAPYLDVALTSLLQNASKEFRYRIHILYRQLNDENRRKLCRFSGENAEIQFVYIEEGLESITDRKENRLRCDYFTLTIYFRLFIAEMFPVYDKGIYMDSDTVVCGDVSELYEYDLEENLFGAVPDPVRFEPHLAYYMERAIGIVPDTYVNSGVLLMNLKKLREVCFCEKFLHLLNTYHFDTVAPDQDYVNAMSNGKILFLPDEWNTMPDNNRSSLSAPKLIHYNLFEKPWCYTGIQYEEVFWKYAALSAYEQELKDHLKHYTEEQKASDKECMQRIIEHGVEIADTENTFRCAAESGEKIKI